MAILDGTIDKVIEEERKNIAGYLKGSIKLKIERDGEEKKMIDGIYKRMVKK